MDEDILEARLDLAPASAGLVALFPAARERARKLIAAGGESEMRNRCVDMLFAVAHAVHASDEIQIFANRQVFPERKALGHVAHVALDFLGLAQDVVAQA